MALTPDAKRKLMEAAIERERMAFKARSRSQTSAPVRDGIIDAAKRHTRDVAKGLKNISKAGWPTVVVGAAVYAAHIQQMDRERHRQHGRLPQRNTKIRGMERDYA
jgi:hypothetical protein